MACGNYMKFKFVSMNKFYWYVIATSIYVLSMAPYLLQQQSCSEPIWPTLLKMFTIWLFTEKVWSRIMDLSQEDSNGAEVQIQTELCGVGQVASPS